MIPSIDDILFGLSTGLYTVEQARGWIAQHIETAYQRETEESERRHFAAMAMQGLLSNLREIRAEGFKDAEIEEFAVMRADALIEALNASSEGLRK